MYRNELDVTTQSNWPSPGFTSNIKDHRTKQIGYTRRKISLNIKKTTNRKDQSEQK